MKKYLLPILWMIAICTLSSIPGNQFPKLPFPVFDKIVHFAEYAVLGFLWARVLGKRIILIIFIGFCFGILDEIHQVFIPYREFSIFDLFFDFFGIVFGIICQLLLKRLQSVH